MARQIRASKTKEHLVKDQRQTRRDADKPSPPSSAKLPEDLIKTLKKSKDAEAFFRTLNKANIYSAVFRLENAKNRESRRMKINSMIKMFENGEKFH